MIAKVIVGSQLHGLATANSDTDYVEVFMSPPHILFSPFYTQRAHVQNDNVSQFELRHLLYLCTKGNPTALEVLWSTKIEEADPIWYTILSKRTQLVAARPVFEAHRGYSLSQKKLKEGDNPTRQVKARVAELRILTQGTDLLYKGTFSANVGIYHDILSAYKNGDRSLEPEIDHIIDKEQQALETAYNSTVLPTEIDRHWFDRWVFELYLSMHRSYEWDHQSHAKKLRS